MQDTIMLIELRKRGERYKMFTIVRSSFQNVIQRRTSGCMGERNGVVPQIYTLLLDEVMNVLLGEREDNRGTKTWNSYPLCVESVWSRNCFT